MKESGSQLILSDVAREYLESFRRSERISKRASKHIIDIANTSTLLDKSKQIDSEHIIEAMQCRVFDRMAWATSVSDQSIVDFLISDNFKTDLRVNSTNG